jgi:hypothetical protein
MALASSVHSCCSPTLDQQPVQVCIIVLKCSMCISTVNTNLNTYIQFESQVQRESVERMYSLLEVNCHCVAGARTRTSYTCTTAYYSLQTV